MSKNTRFIKKLVLVALLGGSLNVVKFLLMYIPNVEAVTLFIFVYTYAFGLNIGLSASLIFCVLEGYMFGFNFSWLLPYFIHWPFISAVAFLCRSLHVKSPILLAAAAGIATALFGLQSTFFYFLTGGAVGRTGWIERFLLVYVSGVWFYVAQTVGNIILLLFAFKPLYKLLSRLGAVYFNEKPAL